MTLTEKLKAVREMNNLSMNAMSLAMGISQPTYSRIEAGMTNMSESVMDQLAAITGVPASVWMDEQESIPATVKVDTQANKPAKKADPDDPYQTKWRRLLIQLAGKFNSQTEFAEELGIDYPALSRLLRGKTRLTRATMFKVGSVTGNYDWYVLPTTLDNEGPILREYLNYKGISQHDFARQLGQAGSTTSVMLDRDTIKKSKWREIEQILGVSKDSVVNQISNLAKASVNEGGNINEISYNNTTPVELIDKGIVTNRRVKPLFDALGGASIIRIPAFLRSGFTYQHFMTIAPTELIPLYQLTRLRNPSLSDEQRQQLIPRYNLFEIGNDFMEAAGLRPGVEAIGFRLLESEWNDHSGVSTVETSTGRLFVGRIITNTLAEKDTLTFTCDDPMGGSLTLNKSQIVNLWHIETLIAPVR